jgi:hypothetical protein
MSALQMMEVGMDNCGCSICEGLTEVSHDELLTVARDNGVAPEDIQVLCNSCDRLVALGMAFLKCKWLDKEVAMKCS